MGALNRLLLVKLPAILYGIDERLTGGRLYASLARIGRYLMNENHPLVLVRQKSWVK